MRRLIFSSLAAPNPAPLSSTVHIYIYPSDEPPPPHNRSNTSNTSPSSSFSAPPAPAAPPPATRPCRRNSPPFYSPKRLPSVGRLSSAPRVPALLYLQQVVSPVLANGCPQLGPPKHVSRECVDILKMAFSPARCSPAGVCFPSCRDSGSNALGGAGPRPRLPLLGVCFPSSGNPEKTPQMELGFAGPRR